VATRSRVQGELSPLPPSAAIPEELRFEAPVVLGRHLRYGVAIASLTAAAIHASAIAGHAFHWLHLMAFVAMTIFQAWWAYLILRSPARSILLIGALGHGAILVLWLISRTSGIPDFLPGAHDAESIGLKDGAASLLALVVIGGIDAVSRRDIANRFVRPSTAGLASGVFLLAVLLLGASATLASGHAHDEFTGDRQAEPHHR